MDMNGDQPEVLIAGAGPVGQFAALALAKRGIRVRIVDTGIWACTHSYALALHPHSIKLLDQLGLSSRLRDRAYPVKTIGLYDSALRKGQIRLNAPMYVLGQDAIEEVLEKALRDLGVGIEWRHELTSLETGQNNVQAHIDKFEKESRGYVVAHTEWVLAKSETLEVPFVIGADGYNSRVRRAAGIEFEETGPPIYYAVFEFKSNFELAGEMRIVLGDDTTDVLWPLANGYCRWSFQLPGYATSENERTKDRMLVAGAAGSSSMLDESNLRTFISQRAPWFRGSVEGFSFRMLARFERRLARRFGAGRLWLAGDAAHLTGPVGIQSMNLGFEEAADLAETVARILTNMASSRELEAYDTRWTSAWRQLQGREGGLRPKAGTDPWMAQHASRLVSCLPAHGSELGQMAEQLGLELADPAVG